MCNLKFFLINHAWMKKLDLSNLIPIGEQLSFFEPRMLLHLLKTWSFHRIFQQHKLHEIDSFIGKVVWEFKIDALDLVEGAILAYNVKWWLTY